MGSCAGQQRRPSVRPSDLGSSVQEFCRTSSAHGLGHLPDTSGPPRCAWLVIVLILMVALFYNVGVSLYREAVHQPIKTENTWVMSGGSLPIPQVTLCDLSVFRQSRLSARNISNQLASYIASSLGGDGFTHLGFLQDEERQERLQAEYEAALEPGETFSDLVESLSPRCDDVIKSCRLADEAMIGAQCCRRHMTPVYTVRGKCFQMSDFVQKGEGRQHGLLLTLSLPPVDFPLMDRTIVSGCINTRLEGRRAVRRGGGGGAAVERREHRVHEAVPVCCLPGHRE